MKKMKIILNRAIQAMKIRTVKNNIKIGVKNCKLYKMIGK